MIYWKLGVERGRPDDRTWNTGQIVKVAKRVKKYEQVHLEPAVYLVST